MRGTILNALRWLTGCGTQHPHRALGGTRVLLAAAPTTPPCFRHWRRSSSLLRIISGKIIIICGSETPAGVSEPLFHEWGTPSVIACGDATFPKGTASAVAGNFTALPKGVPLRADFPRPGEDVAQRQKGESGERSEPEGVIPAPQTVPPRKKAPPLRGSWHRAAMTERVFTQTVPRRSLRLCLPHRQRQAWSCPLRLWSWCWSHDRPSAEQR